MREPAAAARIVAIPPVRPVGIDTQRPRLLPPSARPFLMLLIPSGPKLSGDEGSASPRSQRGEAVTFCAAHGARPSCGAVLPALFWKRRSEPWKGRRDLAHLQTAWTRRCFSRRRGAGMECILVCFQPGNQNVDGIERPPIGGELPELLVVARSSGRCLGTRNTCALPGWFAQVQPNKCWAVPIGRIQVRRWIRFLRSSHAANEDTVVLPLIHIDERRCRRGVFGAVFADGTASPWIGSSSFVWSLS